MKLSNKILVGFFGFIFLYLTAAFAELRLTGSRTPFGELDRSIAETADLSRITFIVIHDIHVNIAVIGSDQARLDVHSISGDLLKKLTYKVSGDTLTLSGFESEENDRTVRISVFVPSITLKGITVKSSNATIQGLQLELLHISQNAARIYMTDNKISKMQIDVANGSMLNMSNTNVDTLSAIIEGSQVNANFVELLQGSLENNSSLVVGRVREIQLKKDGNSRLFIM